MVTKEQMFITCAFIIIAMNVVYYVQQGEIIWEKIAYSGALGFIITGIGIGALLSVNIATWSLDSQFIKIVMSIMFFMNMFFSIEFNVNGNVVGVGLGLISNIYTVFDNGDWFYLGKISLTIITLIMFITGLMIVSE